MCKLTHDKLQAYIWMHQEIISNVRIAHRCDCSESIISRFIKRFKTEELLQKMPRSDHLMLSFKLSVVTLTWLRCKIYLCILLHLQESRMWPCLSLSVPEQFQETVQTLKIKSLFQKKRTEVRQDAQNWRISEWRQVKCSNLSPFPLNFN